MSFALRGLQPVARQLRTSEHAFSLQQLRRMAGDAHGEQKVDAWKAPTNISAWKEEHIVFLVLGSWAVVIYGSLKIFGGKKDPAAAAEATPAAAAVH